METGTLTGQSLLFHNAQRSTSSFSAASVSIAFVLTILFVPGGFFMIPGLAIGKVYAISLLVLLNNRFMILGGRQKDEPSFLLPSEIVEIDTVLSSVSRSLSVPTASS